MGIAMKVEVRTSKEPKCPTGIAATCFVAVFSAGHVVCKEGLIKIFFNIFV